MTTTSAHRRPATDAVPALPAVSVPRAIAAGSLAAAAALGVGELAAGLVRGSTPPVVAVGNWVVDHVPASVKTFAIRRFGEHDKQALIAGTVALLVAFAMAIGVVARRQRRLAFAGVAVFGLVGVLATLARPVARLRDAVPSVAGAAAAAAVLAIVVRRSRLAVGETPTPAGLGRRNFLMAAGGTVAVAAGAGALGRVLRQRVSVAAERAGIVLPRPRAAAAALPPGIDPTAAGITSFVTPNADFYRVDTALVLPQVSAAEWRLRVHGMVDRELRISYDELLARPLVERDLTLVCVSNEVGGRYAGTARWLGVPLAELLREAGVRNGADQLVSRSVDGWTAGSPIAAVLDGRDALLAVGMNGEPLPVAHGFPARLIVPGLYGYVSATKWLTDLEVTTFDRFDAYWTTRGWAKQAPVKTFSRIDTPRGLQRIAAGRTAVAGVAWAPRHGISAVEVQIDDGPWRPARLAATVGPDTWVQWVLDWEATPGSHSIACRATDGAGRLQTADRAEPMPDGATGWHQIVVLVA